MKLAAIFGLILLPNIIRMWWFIIFKPNIRIPVSKYFSGLWELLLHMFTQKRALDCDENQFRWFEHFILVIGYLGLLFTTVFLDWFSSKNLFIIVPFGKWPHFLYRSFAMYFAKIKS